MCDVGDPFKGMVTMRLDSIFSRYCSVAMRIRWDNGIPEFSETVFKRAVMSALKRTGMAELRLTEKPYTMPTIRFKTKRLDAGVSVGTTLYNNERRRAGAAHFSPLFDANAGADKQAFA